MKKHFTSIEVVDMFTKITTGTDLQEKRDLILKIVIKIKNLQKLD